LAAEVCAGRGPLCGVPSRVAFCGPGRPQSVTLFVSGRLASRACGRGRPVGSLAFGSWVEPAPGRPSAAWAAGAGQAPAL
jgi:hypothetical protein